MKTEIRFFKCPSAEYEKALALRYRVLRVPLGLEFTAEEMKKDEEDIHAGLFENGELHACLTLTETGSKRVKMRQVAVEEKSQSRGLGSELSKAAEKYAREKGFEVMFCHARKTAVPFYLKLGYKITGDEFTEVNIPHLVMEKQL